jgi:hypothetical protein
MGAEQIRDLLIRPNKRRATPATVNATMRRLGLDVKWSKEAVEQLMAAAAVARQYVRRHPEQADALVRDPEAVLRALVTEGLLSTPVDALEAALTATRRHSTAPETALRVRVDDASQAADG